MQCSLFGTGPPRFDARFSGARRVQLAGGAWIEHHPGWLDGHARVFEQLASQIAWRSVRRQMYEREVEVPRLIADAPESGPLAGLLGKLSRALSQRFGWPLTRVSLAYYRDGRDSVAFHGDKVGRLANDCIVATVSVGAPRRFLLAPHLPGRHWVARDVAARHVAARDVAARDVAARDVAAGDVAAGEVAARDLSTQQLSTSELSARSFRAPGSFARGLPVERAPKAGASREDGVVPVSIGEGSSRAYDLGWGDLFVMGGSCQRTWQHAVPKRAHADPRISIMFRPPLEWSHG